MNKGKSTPTHFNSKFSSGNLSVPSSQSNTHKSNSSDEHKGHSPLSRPSCNYYKKTGHLISDCFTLKRRQQQRDEAEPTGLTTSRSKPQTCIDNNVILKVKEPKSDSIMEIYEFLSEGSVSVIGDTCPPTPIKIFRDTGASQSLILADTLSFSEKTSSGFIVLIQGVECGFSNVPLHNIYLSSDLATGPVAVGIRSLFPFKGVHLLLGYYLAEDKVVVNPLVTDTACVDQTPDPIEQEISDLYPSCAVTRAMAKKAIQGDSYCSDIDLADTFIGQSLIMT
jgi:hypothetical protein